MSRDAASLGVALTALMVGCGAPVKEVDVVHQYAVNLSANYQDAITGAQALQVAVDAFVANPSAAGLTAAQSAWLSARPAYGHCEISRFYGGPIDTAQGGLNEWPIDENFIDYTIGNATGGIINDPAQYPQLTPQVISTADEVGGTENLSTGFHAIEFLLWGQRPDPMGGPGQRPYTDYLDGGTAANQDRRRTYLKIAAELLVSDLKALAGTWNLDDPASYGAKMVAGPPHDGVANIVRGLSNMAIAELGYERLSDPYRTMDRKDEESCFSESTWGDLQANVLGVEDAYVGHYGMLQGPSVSDLALAKDAALDAKVKLQIQALKAALAAIPQPFDHSVLAPVDSDANQKVKAALDAVAPLRDALDTLGTTLDIPLNL